MAFIAEIDCCVSLASAEPRNYAMVLGEISRVVVNSFLYSVYFRAEQRRIVVLAVFYISRGPAVLLGGE
jgi:hypothetical protein